MLNEPDISYANDRQTDPVIIPTQQRLPFPAHAERVRDAVDVIEPRRNEGNLENGLVIEACLAQPLVVGSADLCSILGKLDDVLHHHALRRGEGRLRVIRLKRFNQCLIESDATQKLCVGLDSINTPISHRNHGGDDLMLSAAERKVGRHKYAEGRESVKERVRDEAV